MTDREVARPTVEDVMARAAMRAETATASAVEALAAARREHDEELGSDT